MSTSKTWPGAATATAPTAYTIPAAGELNWSSLSAFLIALADSAQATSFQKFAVRKATTTPVTVSATTDCVVVTHLAAPGAVAVAIPAGANKQVFAVVDGLGDANTNNITITPNGAETIAGAATLVLSRARETVILIYNSSDTDWKIVARTTGTPMSNPMDSAGDMVYGGASGAETKLDAGTAGMILHSAGAAAPAWVNTITTAKTFSATTDASSSTTGTIICSGGLGVAKKAYIGTSLNFSDTTKGIVGTVTNDDAASGFVGELLQADLLVGSAVSLTTATAADVVTLSLTAGDWDVAASVSYLPAAGTSVTTLNTAVSKTSATLPSAQGNPVSGEMRVTWANAGDIGGNVVKSQSIPSYRVSVASTTTMYLIARATFSVSTMTAYGSIWARRAR